MLLDFNDKDVVQRWTTVNDNVMGGKSEGGPSFKEGVLTFAGKTNTNGGGFSSIRTKPMTFDMAKAMGLLIRVRGDGRAYKAEVWTGLERGSIRISFRADFKTKVNVWQEIKVPFEKFEATLFGEVVQPEKPLAPEDVKTIGFMIYDGNDGPFKLEVDWVKAYYNDE